MIGKEIFCAVIENLRQQLYLDKKFGEAIQEMFGSKSMCSYNDNLLVKSLMKLLQVHFPKDEDDFCLIEFYCFEIEFGKTENKEIISPEDLYDQLISKIKNK
jgi:hypothetical protein